MGKYNLKDFLPLIVIFSFIILATGVTQIFSPVFNLNFLMRDFMGIFFITFGTFKIIKLKNFAQAYAEYDLIAKYSRLYALIYPFIELILGVLYLFGVFFIATSWATLIIMLISAAGVANELSKGKMIMCACLGTVFKIPMTYVTLIEDLLMAFMAAMMLLQ